MKKLLVLFLAFLLVLGGMPSTLNAQQSDAAGDNTLFEQIRLFWSQYEQSITGLLDEFNSEGTTSIGGASQSEENTNDKQTESSVKEFEKKVVELTNKERAERGLEPLEISEELTAVAREKSKDMRDNNYFDHTSPTYGSPFTMMSEFGIQYTAAGENIAAGQKSPAQVVDDWMNSKGHRENILNNQYTHIAIGYVEGGEYRYYWTQHFIRK